MSRDPILDEQWQAFQRAMRRDEMYARRRRTVGYAIGLAVICVASYLLVLIGDLGEYS